jgi:hypothetical protein
VTGGGIHFARTAVPLDPITEDLIVRYDRASQRIHVITRGGARFTSDFTVEPQSLKALYRYAASGQTMAISLERRTVFLDPSLVDTRVGQDLILADVLPWRLDEKLLPNGKGNLIHAEFASARAEERSRLALRDERAVTQLVNAVMPLKREPSPDMFGQSDTAGDLESALKSYEVNLQREVQRLQAAVLVASMPHTNRATLVDNDPVLVSLRQGSLSIYTPMRYMFMTQALSVKGNKVYPHAKDDPKMEIEHLPTLEQLVNSNREMLFERYEPLTRIQRYAGISAFLKWAMTAPEVKAIDLRALIDVPAFDPRNTPTADHIDR